MRWIAAFVVLTTFLCSCGKTEEKDPVKLLSRRWELKNDSTQFIHFLNRGENDHLVTIRLNQFSEDTVKGKWQLSGAEIHVDILRSKAIHQAVDSIVFTADENGTQLELMSGDAELARISKGELNDLKNQFVWKIDTLSQQGLVMTLPGEASQVFRYRSTIKEYPLSVESILRGLAGLLFLVMISWLLSENKKAINWRLVITGIVLQLVFAIGVLKVPFIETMFEGISGFFIKVISFTQEGTDFLFSSFTSGQIESSLLNFVVKVLPTVIFFSALTSLFFYWGILQKVVYGLAWVMKKTMRLSGAESMAAAGNIFLGQTEAPLLVKPYLGTMTRSEMMCLMSGGMATIAGGVLAAYVGFLGGDDPEAQLYFAKHLLAASVMSAPAAIVAAKLLVPETESFNNEMKIPKEKIGSNALEAITNGTSDGLRLAANVAAMLLVFIALIAMGNFVMKEIIGEYTGLNAMIQSHTNYEGLTLQFIVGYIGAPIAYLIGVPAQDTVLVGQLLGEKTILNEFYAYTTLGDLKSQGAFVNEKSIIMATYILCGFANFASIGIQIGGIGSLAPNKKPILSQLGFKALIGGTIACLLTATVVGMLM